MEVFRVAVGLIYNPPVVDVAAMDIIPPEGGPIPNKQEWSMVDVRQYKNRFGETCGDD
jgi:hypothetical protein